MNTTLQFDPQANPLALWDSVRTPDPTRIKTFTRSGGFKGTAINAVYLARRATEAFGPYGVGWKLEILDEQFVKGAPVLNEDGHEVGHEKIHVVRVRLDYKIGGGGDWIEGPTQFGQTTFVGKNKYGLFTDEEAPKKSLTDAMTKCMSWLGFAADVHMGLFDDNKYVQDVREAYEVKMRKEAEERAKAARQPMPEDKAESLKQKIAGLQDVATLEAALAATEAKFLLTDEQKALFAARRQALTATQEEAA